MCFGYESDVICTCPLLSWLPAHSADGLLCCAEAFEQDVVSFIFVFVAFAFSATSKIIAKTTVKELTCLCFLIGLLWSYIQVFNPF